jgi:hypothetical protein
MSVSICWLTNNNNNNCQPQQQQQLLSPPPTTTIHDTQRRLSHSKRPSQPPSTAHNHLAHNDNVAMQCHTVLTAKRGTAVLRGHGDIDMPRCHCQQ